MSDAVRIKVVEKKTGQMFEAVKIDGGYQLFTLKHDTYKKLKDSTVKKLYTILKDKDEEKPKTAEKPKATDANIPVKDISEEKRKSLVSKIKKILALSENNPSQEEAMAAALQAQKLMVEYNIHEEDITYEEIEDEIDSIFSQQKHNSHLLKWRVFLANIVAKNFRCKSYLHGKDIVFRGYKQDAEIALEVYLTLYATGNALGNKAYAEQMKQTGSGKGAYNSFVMGFLKGIEQGFGEQSTALMVIVPKEVEEEFEKFSKDFIKNKTHIQRVTNFGLFKEGEKEGRSAVKSRAIEKKGSGK